jgi:hypothetical protein
MGKRLVSKTAKVLSETKKSKDKEAVAISYEHIPRNPEEQSHGSLYAVIEIEDNAGHAEEIAESILDTLHQEYYDDPTKEPLASFEGALAKINEELAERSGQGQINWIGKLNAILAVLAENTLHLTQAGKAEAYLYRGEHGMHITEDLAGDSVNPLRTFINVASGDLAENDKIALVTPGVFFKLSKSELKNYISSNSPKIAVEDISKILSGENGTSLPNAVLIMEMLSPEAYAAEPQPEVPSEAWIKEEHKPLEEVSEHTIHGAAKAFDVLGKAATGASAFISAKAIPAVKTGGAKLSTKIKGFKKEAGAESVILSSEERLTPDSIMDNSGLMVSESVLEPVSEEPGFSNEIRIKEEHKPRILSLERFNFSFLKSAGNKVGGIGKGISLPKGKASLVYLGVGLLLIASLFGYLVYSKGAGKSTKAAENIYNQATEKYKTAEEEIASGQRSLALEDLEAAEKLANDAKNAKYKTADVENLLAQIQTSKEKAMGVIKNTAQLSVDFGKGNLGGLYSDGKLLYGVNFEDGSVYAADPKAKTIATVVEKPKIDGKIKFATLVTKRRTLVAYTDTNCLYEIDLVAKKATKQTVEGELEDAVAIASYNTNIYLLSPSANQIYKHTKTTGGYSKKISYVTKTNPGELSSGVDLGIDSDVYVTTANGQVEKYTSGAKQNYAISGSPAEFTEIKHLFVDANVKGQYLYGAGKVIKIDENQAFVGQYVSDSVKNITGLYVDDTTNTVYILSEGKIFNLGF